MAYGGGIQIYGGTEKIAPQSDERLAMQLQAKEEAKLRMADQK